MKSDENNELISPLVEKRSLVPFLYDRSDLFFLLWTDGHLRRPTRGRVGGSAWFGLCSDTSTGTTRGAVRLGPILLDYVRPLTSTARTRSVRGHWRRRGWWHCCTWGQHWWRLKWQYEGRTSGNRKVGVRPTGQRSLPKGVERRSLSSHL